LSDLSRVVALGTLLCDRRAALAKAEASTAELKAEVMKLERDDLPALMAELGLQEVKLANGVVITIKEEVESHISVERRPEAHAWLLAHGYGGIIKTVVSVQFAKGEHDAAVSVEHDLQSKYDRPVALEEVVHPSTLKSFVKERLSAGEALPMDLFGAFVFSKAVIKG